MKQENKKADVSPKKSRQYTALKLRALWRSDSLLCRFNWSSDLNCRAQSKHINPVTSENSNSTSAGTGVVPFAEGLSTGFIEEGPGVAARVATEVKGTVVSCVSSS